MLFESLKINISVIKHTHHPIEGDDDSKEKDTYRLTRRGTSSVGLLGDNSFKLDKNSKINLQDVMHLFKD